MSTLEVTSRSEAETRTIARHLAVRLRAGDVVALDGPLGSGKTAFVRGLAEGLGIEPAMVSSPTFVICHEYAPAPGPDGSAGGAVLFHLDAYRLAAPDELETVGWDELIAEGRGVVVVEWAERIRSRLPERRIRIEMGHVSASERSLAIEAPDGIALTGLSP